MPTPTASRALSPESQSNNPSTLHLTSSPIPIPGADISDLASKRAPQDACTAAASDALFVEDAPMPMSTDMICDSARHANAAPARNPSISTESNDMFAVSPGSDHSLSATPPPSSRLAATIPPQQQQSAAASTNHAHSSLRRNPWEVASSRIRPLITSSFLRPNSRFVGTQRSDKATYKVEVQVKYVDMAQSTMCGFLRIEGLTETLPVITTYFDGEIVGTRYGFQTKHASWGATAKTDMQHWRRFEEFEPLYSDAKHERFHDPDFANKENIFMRWKEQFLVPDHRKSDLTGASFEGFYYIVFNQVRGEISGIYFHSKSEKYQKLKLHHVAERPGMFCAPPAIEFR